ncbi:ImpB/MucB/SamB family protein [Dictyocaulus viviparus]|uniref:ImpB/MucB/SamB family protein n=1 Tax=Dictyocaulus viviparus TaxID=29172 RepID=A0A0D8Y2N6_DICVI|nr:ImpB/MucB/SamB family protein [Dictyocaulus viviparus]
MERVIGLIDMDCFYAQVEQKEQPELWEKPVVVVQHAREGTPGGILAVSYEARNFGVKRGMMIPDAITKCPDLVVCFVPQGEHIDKADIQKYRSVKAEITDIRDASAEVFEIMNTFDDRIIVERASVDEAFLDLTEMVDQKIIECGSEWLSNIGVNNTGRFLDGFARLCNISFWFGFYVLYDNLSNDISSTLPTSHLADGNDKDDNKEYDREESLRNWLSTHCTKEISHLRLAIAALTLEQMRAKIRECTQFFCSGGIANNKMLAKLVCSRHKPRQQTILPFDFVPVIFKETPIGDVRMLGGKLGRAIQDSLAVTTMAELADVPFTMIERHFEGQARWIHQLAKGYDDELVKRRNSQLSIANSFGHKWIEGLSKELSKRLVADQIKNKRTAENLVFGVLGETSTTRTLKIASYRPQSLAEMIWRVAKTLNRAKAGSGQIPPILNLSISASRFTDGVSAQSQNIMEWVEKRLKLNECGGGAPNTSVSFPKSRVLEKDVLGVALEEVACSSTTSACENSPHKIFSEATNAELKSEVDVDDDGWQIYNPEKFETVNIREDHAVNLENSVICTSALKDFPADIQEEFAHFHKLEQAKKLKEATAEREKHRVTSKKRHSKTTVKASPMKKKRIESFFKKE